MFRHRWLIALAAIATAFFLVAADNADARAGRGFSGGSRGMRTYSAPAATQTAPNAASPIQRSVTQPGRTANAAQTAARPGLFGGMFGGGLLGGLAAGFLGAGLFGLLFGHGLFGGMAGLGGTCKRSRIRRSNWSMRSRIFAASVMWQSRYASGTFGVHSQT
jgi:predicted lipid-binding transport protein (Tim44 family)